MDFEKINKDLSISSKLSNFLNEFINELKDIRRNTNDNNYWYYKNSIRDNVSAIIGISRWSSDITYRKELEEKIKESIFEVSKKEGIIYRKKFSVNNYDDDFFDVYKFENGNMSIVKEKIPKEFHNKEIIFQYNEEYGFRLRDDLKEEIINKTTNKAKYFKEIEEKRNLEYKIEGHVYEAFEDDGYIFLNDVTKKEEKSIEDIDFAKYNYHGDGKYKVIDGEYVKIDN